MKKFEYKVMAIPTSVVFCTKEYEKIAAEIVALAVVLTINS